MNHSAINGCFGSHTAALPFLCGAKKSAGRLINVTDNLCPVGVNDPAVNSLVKAIGIIMHYGWTLVAASLLLQTAVSSAEEASIGSASSVKNRVEGTVRGQTQSLSSGSAVYSNEAVRTGQDSVAELGFVDSTKLSVGPTSEVRLDKFVYDPNKRAGAVALKATRGSLRFVTGVQDHDNYSIKTPYATLGVRGTVLEIVVRPGRTQKHHARAERQVGSRGRG